MKNIRLFSSFLVLILLVAAAASAQITPSDDAMPAQSASPAFGSTTANAILELLRQSCVRTTLQFNTASIVTDSWIEEPELSGCVAV